MSTVLRRDVCKPACKTTPRCFHGLKGGPFSVIALYVEGVRSRHWCRSVRGPRRDGFGRSIRREMGGRLVSNHDSVVASEERRCKFVQARPNREPGKDLPARWHRGITGGHDIPVIGIVRSGTADRPRTRRSGARWHVPIAQPIIGCGDQGAPVGSEGQPLIGDLWPAQITELRARLEMPHLDQVVIASVTSSCSCVGKKTTRETSALWPRSVA